MAKLTDFISAGLSSSGTELVFNSNVTPEILIDVKQLTSKKPVSKTAVKSSNGFILKLIQPEIIFESMGVQKSVAPHGKPYAEGFTLLFIAMAATGLVGAGIAWSMCKKVGK